MDLKNLFFTCSKLKITGLAFFITTFFFVSLHKTATKIQVIHPYYRTTTNVDLFLHKTESTISLYKMLASSIYNSKYTGVQTYTEYYIAQFGLKSLDQIQPILPSLGPVINDCTSLQYPININTCATQTDVNKTSIFIAVVSAPNNFVMRNMVRSTWKKHLKNDVVTGLIDVFGFAFLIGKTDNVSVQATIEQESRNHSDIIQVDMVDSYNNLTLKSVSILNWVVNYCPLVHFVLKIDDDVYVNVRNLAATIRSLQPSVKSIYGRPLGASVPSRGGSKWSYSFEMWPWTHLPKYIDGPAYLISGSAVAFLLASAQTTPLFASEDLYISGLCNIKVNVTTHSSLNMLVHNPPEGMPDACFVKETTMWVSDNYLVSWMNMSHELTEQFYGNKVNCSTERNSLGSVNADDPNNFVASNFKLVLNPEVV